MGFTPFFLPTPDGQRFCVHHAAAGSPRGAIVYLAPFAEEMHKARRMAALQSRAFAAAGYAVLQIDLHGCGDSSGDFGDARWDTWVDDAGRAAAWLRERTDAPLWFWGLRTGALLAAQAVGHQAGGAGLILWNPVVSGKQYLQQFLRLKLAGEMLGGDAKGLMDELRKSLAAGQAIEVAGYRLDAALAAALENAELAGFCAGTSIRSIRWLETSPRAEAALTPAAQAACEKLRAACPDLRAATVQGPAFWQTTEIEDAPALVPATLAAIDASP